MSLQMAAPIEGYFRFRLLDFGDFISHLYEYRMITEILPGKNGGQFDLPFGGYMTVQPLTFTRRDIITCCIVAPSNRHKYLPPLKVNEKLLSEIFLFSAGAKTPKKPVIIKLMHYKHNFDFCNIEILSKPVQDDIWTRMTFNHSQQANFVEFEVVHTGAYVAVSTPRTEVFIAPMMGCLHASTLSRNISVRFPKKAIDRDIPCEMQILPLNQELVTELREEHSHDISDLVALSDFFSIQLNTPAVFKRSVTVKLPLPVCDQDEFPPDDIAIMQLANDGTWQIVDSPLKLTKGTVSFDTNTLSRFCVAYAMPQRKRRLRELLSHIHNGNAATRGDVITFIHLENKAWTLWVESVRNSKIEEIVEIRHKQGFTQIGRRKKAKVSENNSFHRGWKPRIKKVSDENDNERTDLDLIDGDPMEVDLVGDLKIADDDKNEGNMNLYYHDLMPENYRKFLIEPATEQKDAFEEVTGTVQIFMNTTDEEGNFLRLSTRKFDVVINEESVNAFFWVKPEPEPTPKPLHKKEETAQIAAALLEKYARLPPAGKASPKKTTTAVVKEKVPTKSLIVHESSRKQYAHHSNSISPGLLRLSQGKKPPKHLVKESKVLSGRSLMALSRHVQQGLTLAIYLDLNDSAITGMGFDALAKGLSLVEITYKVLMLWKRKTGKQKDKQVELLVQALREMGRADVAETVYEKSIENTELTDDCFSSGSDVLLL